MEANIRCAYNVSRGCRVSSKVTVAHCANEPFKLMKVMLDSLAKDPEGGFWLTRLSHSPQIVRLFPFDFLYLDTELNIIQAVELPAEAILPRFHPRAASALILPINSLSSSGTVEGDRLIICALDELEHRLAEPAPQPLVEKARVPAYVSPSFETLKPRTAPISKPSPAPIPRPSTPVLIPAAAQGSGYTFAVTSSWQISNSTTAGILLEPLETEEIKATDEGLLIPDADGLEEESTQAMVADPKLSVHESILLEPVTPVEDAQIVAEALIPQSPAMAEAKPEYAAKHEAAASAGTIEDTVRRVEARARIEDESLTILDTDFAAAFDRQFPEDFAKMDTAVALDDDIADTKILETAKAVSVTEQPVAITDAPTPNARAEAAARENESLPVNNPAAEAESRQVATCDAEPKAVIKPATLTRERGALAENAPSTTTPAGPAASRTKSPETAKTKSAEVAKAKSASQSRKKSFGLLFKEFLNCPDPLPELRAHPRLVQQGMIAVEKSSSSSAAWEVRDVSPTGFYLRTKKRWQPGKVVSLTLQKKDAPEGEYQNFVDVNGKVVRCDEDGVGLSWIFPDGIQFDPWKRLHTKRSDESDMQFFIREIRLARAEGFLQRICPTVRDQVKHALRERLSNKRVASAVEIALKAEKSLGGNGKVGLAHSEVVMRAVENGSWIEDEWIRKMWAGLLVSSCGDGNDRSNLQFLDLLARLTPIHLRVFSFVCERAAKAMAEGESEATLDLHSTAEELMEAADSHSFQRVQQTIGHLCNYGLLKESSRPSYAAIDDTVRTKTTPTPLGLKMYARCNGQR